MCGIAGIMTRAGRRPDPDAAARLTAALHHRGPDGDGVYADGAVLLADTRLAIVDVAGGQQPLYGPGGAVLVANGEIYNAPELREELQRDELTGQAGGGAAFGTLSDCEPAVHLFERLGPAYAQRLRGMYAIAIYDPATGRLVVSRDRFGIKPLYYVETAEHGFAFASEPAALFAAGLATPAVVDAKVGELLQLKHVTGEQTIFGGVRRVAPGETLVVEDGRVVERHRIATLAPPLRPARTPLKHALAGFERVMTDSVAVHLRTDVPYGLFFSGGIDSSILLTLMQRIAGERVQALTLGYAGDLPGDESRDALEIARGAGADCRRVEMSADDFWRFAPRIAAAVDDPTTDAAVLPTWMLGRAARADGLKVTLCGEGADELFGGYSRYRRARLPFTRLPFTRLPLTGANEKRGVFDAVEGIGGGFPGWSAGLDAAWAGLRADGRSRAGALQALDCVERLPNSLLVKLDRCLMANSVEGRTPFLDREVAAFAASLPDPLKAGLRHGKVVLREWLARANPAARPFARKQGFNPPVGTWMAARAAELGPLVAAHPAITPLAEASGVRRLFEDAQRRHQPAWSLLFYALWCSHHVLRHRSDGDIGEVLDRSAAAARRPRPCAQGPGSGGPPLRRAAVREGRG